MGYINSAISTTLTAKLTPIGRKKLILTNNNLVTSFSLGDSDANYMASLALGSGEVPGDGGDIGAYSSASNSVGPNVSIRSFLLVDSAGNTKKAVEEQSNTVSVSTVANGITTATTANLSQIIIDRSDYGTDALTNLFYTFNLPLDGNADYRYTGLTSAQGGYSDTAISGFAQNKVLVIGIDNSLYGELIDGKSIKLQLTTLISGFTLYSTYQNNGQSLGIMDGLYSDNSSTTSFLGDNIALLFSDNIQRPNSSATLSWGTGNNTVKPFSVNRKQLYNFTTDTNVNEYADKAVGIAYLDKGFIVITDPDIVNWFDVASSATTVVFDSVSTSVAQNITCVINRGEFGVSTNPTFTFSDLPRISEIGLYDTDGDLIAIAKTDRHLERNINEFLALGIKITV